MFPVSAYDSCPHTRGGNYTFDELVSIIVPTHNRVVSPRLPGVRVNHKVYGPGQLIDKKGDIVTVRLDDETEKRFSLTAVLQMKQFSLV